MTDKTVKEHHLPDSLLTRAQVAAACGVCPRTITAWVKRDLLPSPIRVTARAIRWRRSDIATWLKSRHA